MVELLSPTMTSCDRNRKVQSHEAADDGKSYAHLGDLEKKLSKACTITPGSMIQKEISLMRTYHYSYMWPGAELATHQNIKM